METKIPEVKRSLYLKYRPTNFNALIGQDHIRKILEGAAKENKISQGYLLVGPRGTGKTTTARLIAKTLNCENPVDGFPCEKCSSCIAIQDGKFMDVIEIDAASNTGVDNMRELIEKAQFSPSLGKKKVYIIDEVHMLSMSAFNALLKTLEEPPAHVHFILATTEANKVPPTITSRCQRFDFKRIHPNEIVERLEFICKSEEIECEKAGLKIIAKNADGGMRDAISLLEQVVMNKKITTKNVENSLGVVQSLVIEEFINLLLEKKTHLALQAINKIYQDGINLSQLKKETLEYLRQKILIAVDENKVDQISRYLTLINNIVDIKSESSFIPQFPWELMICKTTLSEDILIEREVKEETPIQTHKANQVPPEKPLVMAVKNEETLKPIETPTEEYKFRKEELPNQAFTVKPTLEKIKEEWKNILDKIDNSEIKYSLREGFLENFENDLLEISIRSEFYYNKVKSPQSKKIISDVISDYFDVTIKIEITLSKIEILKEEIKPEIIPENNKKSEISNDDKKTAENNGLDLDRVNDLFSS